MVGNTPSQHYIVWGSYDTGKPRVRLLLEALRRKCGSVTEINIDIWSGIEDKSVAGWSSIIAALFRLLVGYPRALYRLMCTPHGQPIVLPYPAIADIFIVWPMARLRGHPLIFDAFISFYDTIVCDRKRLRQNGVLARILWHVEQLALKLADIILVDTDEHSRYFSATYNIPQLKFVTVLVGAEPLFWDARDGMHSSPELPAEVPSRYVLFYGQFIPLHGIETILQAVAATRDEAIHWLIIGSGQEEHLARDFIKQHAPTNMTWLPWVDYQALPNLIRSADMCLGIFGTSDKAARVIPNKMFQILAAGGTIITRDSPAVAELEQRFPASIRLVPAGDAQALVEAVKERTEGTQRGALPSVVQEDLSPAVGISRLLEVLTNSGKHK